MTTSTAQLGVPSQMMTQSRTSARADSLSGELKASAFGALSRRRRRALLRVDANDGVLSRKPESETLSEETQFDNEPLALGGQSTRMPTCGRAGARPAGKNQIKVPDLTFGSGIASIARAKLPTRLA